MNGVRVKALVWQNDVLFCGQPHAYADTPLGPWTVTAYDGRGGRWAYDDPSGDMSDMDWPTREEAQAAAKADYETRILAALEPQAPLTIASEGPERLWLDVKFRELFLPGEEQYGIEGLVEYRRAALEPQDAPAVAGVEIPAGYTPGPWRAHEVHRPPIGFGPHDTDANGNIFCGYSIWGSDEHGASILPTIAAVHNFPDQVAANARLIALAPAMAEELVALRAEVERLRACAPEQLTRAQIDSACLSYRHDYGLCTESEARHQRHECAEWFRAIRAALTPPASQEGQADD